MAPTDGSFGAERAMRWFLGVVLGVVGAQAAAQDIEFWSGHGDWRLETYAYDDGGRFCVASTRAGPAYLSLIDDGVGRILAIQHSGASLVSSRAIEIWLSSEPSWDLKGLETDAQTIYINLAQHDPDGIWLNRLLASPSATIKTPDRNMAFSMDGAAAAIDDLPECLASFGAFAPVLFADLLRSSVAETLNMPLRFKDWTVDVAMDGSSVYCAATAQGSARSLALYAGTGAGLFMRFSDAAWNWSEANADVALRVDGRAPWNIARALHAGQRVDIGVPENAQSSRFLAQLRAGHRVYLATSGDQEIGDWSLAGSGAALDAWGRCIALIR